MACMGSFLFEISKEDLSSNMFLKVILLLALVSTSGPENFKPLLLGAELTRFLDHTFELSISLLKFQDQGNLPHLMS